jgi:RNA polymerase primary sigma factor
MLTEIGREPTPEQLAAKLAMSLEKVNKLLKIAKEPISLKTAIGDKPVSDAFRVHGADGLISRKRDKPSNRTLGSVTNAVRRALRKGRRARPTADR